jgi:hypothetical protein
MKKKDDAVSSSIVFSFPHTHRRLITFSFFFFLFLWNLITREKKRNGEKEIVVVFGKVQNFFLSTVIIEMSLDFTFSSLTTFSLAFFSHLIERCTQANKNQNIVKRSNGDIRTIYIVLVLSPFSLA